MKYFTLNFALNGFVKFIVICISVLSASLTSHAFAQCSGTWTGNNSGTLLYQCANGPFDKTNGADTCPTVEKVVFTFASQGTVKQVGLGFSAFGSSVSRTHSRMAVFINGNKIDLANAAIVIGCQTPAGAAGVNNGCLIDSIAGADGGISGTITISACGLNIMQLILWV